MSASRLLPALLAFTLPAGLPDARAHVCRGGEPCEGDPARREGEATPGRDDDAHPAAAVADSAAGFPAVRRHRHGMSFRGSVGFLGGAEVGAHGLGLGYRYDHDVFSINADVHGLWAIADDDDDALHLSLDGGAAWVIPTDGPLRPYLGGGAGVALLSARGPDHEAAGVEAILTSGVVWGRSRQLPVFVQLDVRVPVAQLGRDALGTSVLVALGFGLAP